MSVSKVPGHQGYLKLLDEMRELHIKKAQDYGLTEDPLANLRACEDIGIEAWRGCWLRAKDKVKRIDAYCLKGELANESVEDSFLDLAAYSLLALALRREKKPTSPVRDALLKGYDAITCPKCRERMIVSSPLPSLEGRRYACDSCGHTWLSGVDNAPPGKVP